MKQQFFVGDKVCLADKVDKYSHVFWIDEIEKFKGITGVVQDIVTYESGDIGYSVKFDNHYYNCDAKWLTIVERQWQKNTGEQPVEDGVEVEIKLRWPGGKDKCLAGEFRLDFEDCSGDIVEWRIADNVPAVVGDTFGFGKAADEIVKLKGEGMNIQGEKIKCLSNFQAPELVVGKIYTAGITRKNVHGVWQVEVDGKWYIHDRFELVSKEQTEAIPSSHVGLGDEIVSIKQEWTDKHYDNNYTLTQKDIECGFVKIDPYFVSKMWKIGSKDDSGALWHCKNKYSREVKPNVFIDVYDVLRAFEVTDPCLSHLAKKALCAGLRGHKDRLEDLNDIKASIERAIEMHLEWSENGRV